jgi:hypothetical protein
MFTLPIQQSAADDFKAEDAASARGLENRNSNHNIKYWLLDLLSLWHAYYNKPRIITTCSAIRISVIVAGGSKKQCPLFLKPSIICNDQAFASATVIAMDIAPGRRITAKEVLNWKRLGVTLTHAVQAAG